MNASYISPSWLTKEWLNPVLGKRASLCGLFIMIKTKGIG